MSLPATAVILAGGAGMRLRPLLGDTPKVLAPIRGRPFVSRILDQLAAAGIGRSVICTGEGADRVEQSLGESHGSMELVYSREAKPRGTAGAVRDALNRADDPLLVLNGDSYCGVDLSAFARWHRTRGPLGSIVVSRVPDASRYGSVVLDGERIVRFEEKREGGEWVSAGIYLLARTLFDAVPARGSVSLERTLFPGRADSLLGYRTEAGFVDIGIPSAYLEEAGRSP